MTAPPKVAIAAAVDAARRSPCAKSKRGVSVYRDWCDPIALLGSDYNGPPSNSGIGCDGSEACRRDCARRCVHAEMRAVRIADRSGHNPGTLYLVHVKIDEHGELVAGGGPSCWQCSREVLDVGLAGVWLYEAMPARCGNADASGRCMYVGPCAACAIAKARRRADRADGLPADAEWRFYDSATFHRVTCETAQIGGPR